MRVRRCGQSRWQESTRKVGTALAYSALELGSRGLDPFLCVDVLSDLRGFVVDVFACPALISQRPVCAYTVPGIERELACEGQLFIAIEALTGDAQSRNFDLRRERLWPYHR